ncbi:MAG TPA: VOC family protein [Streptosporangiaceae bacterium]|nr:VOC family protein [Streptosporangiaceae bacterium]
MLDRIDHVGIACHDLAAKIAFYESVFELTVVSREVNEEQGVREAMLRVADITAALAASAAAGCACSTSARGMAQWVPPLPFCTRPMWAAC